MSEIELLPCPFCGGRPEVIEFTEDDGFENRGGSAIECQGCLASSRVEFGCKENLISSWNRRAAPPTSELEAENARLKARLAEALKALEPFAAVAEHDIGEDESDNDLFRPLTLFNRVPRIRVRHLRVALAVVREAK